MTVNEILTMTGEIFNTMSKEELIQVNRVLAGASRKRLKNLPKGPAYDILKRRANNTVITGTDKTLYMEQGKIKIATPKSASMQDLRALRKELFNYLQNTTSTKTGYKQHLIDQAMSYTARHKSRLETEEYYKYADVSEIEKVLMKIEQLEKEVNQSDIIDYSMTHANWDSEDVKSTIMEITQCDNVHEAYRRFNGSTMYNQLYKDEVSASLLDKLDEDIRTVKQLKKAVKNQRKNKSLVTFEQNEIDYNTMVSNRTGIDID